MSEPLNTPSALEAAASEEGEPLLMRPITVRPLTERDAQIDSIDSMVRDPLGSVPQLRTPRNLPRAVSDGAERQLYLHGTRGNPDEEAEARRQARSLHVNPRMIRGNPQMQATLAALEKQKKAAQTNITRQFLSEPSRLAVAHDQIDEMGFIEKSGRLAYSGLVRAGIGSRIFLDSISNEQVLKSVFPVDDVMAAIGYDTPEAEEGEEFRGIGSALADFGQDLDQALGLVGEDAQPLSERRVSEASRLAGLEDRQFTSLDEVLDSPVRNVLPFVWEQGLMSAADMVLAMSAMPAYVTMLSGSMADQRAEMDEREEPTFRDILTVLPSSVAVGVMERMGARGIFGVEDAAQEINVRGLRGVSSATGRAAVTESLTEGVQSIFENVATSAGTETGFDLARLNEDILSGMIAGAGVGGGVRLGTATVQARMQARASRDRVGQIRKINERAEKLRDRDPEAYAEFQSRVMRAEGIDGVRLSQAGVEVLNQTITELREQDQGDMAASVQEAINNSRAGDRGESRATQAGVEIPPEAFWSLPKETIDRLAEHVSFRQGELSAVEAEDVESLMNELQAEDFEAEVRSRSEQMDAEDQVFQSVREQLAESGSALSADEAALDSASRQMAAAFRVLSERSGISLEELQERFAPTIRKTFEEGPAPRAATEPAEGPQGPETGTEGQAGPDLATQDGPEAPVAATREGDPTGTTDRGEFRQEDTPDPDDGTLQSLTGITVEELSDADAAEARELFASLSRDQSAVSPAGSAGRTVTGAAPDAEWNVRTSVTVESGDPAIVYRGARRGLSPSNFDPETLGASSSAPTSGLGVFFTMDPSEARSYGPRVESFHLDIRNPRVFNLDDPVPSFDSVGEATAFRESLREEGHDGIVLDYRDIGGPLQFVAFNPEQAIRPQGMATRESADTQREDARPVQRLEQEEKITTGARGSIEFSRMDGVIIRLYRSENLSTFLHESGHLYLEMLGALAEDPRSSQQIRDDFRTVLNWLGVQSREEIGVEQHERWAETYEQYLREGQAPSAELKGAFDKFSAWLTTLYQRIRQATRLPRAALNDDIRRVMDRLLATDDQIEQVRAQQRMFPLFPDAESAGLSMDEYQHLQALEREAAQSAKAELMAETMAELRREQTKAWREEKARRADAIVEEMDEDPVWRARYIIQEGRMPSGAEVPAWTVPGIKLDKAAVDETGYRLPGGNRMTRKKNGVSPERAAQDLGFMSGDHLLSELSRLPQDENGRFLTERQYAEREAQRQMERERGDLMRDDAALREEALQKVHSERQATLLAREMRILRRLRDERQPPRRGRDERTFSNRVIREAARRTIQGKKLSEIGSPAKYLQAERRAAIEAAVATRDGEYGRAYDAKRRQLLNFHLYRFSRDAKSRANKQITRLRKWQNGRMSNVHPEFVKQARELLAPISFVPVPTQRTLDRLSTETLGNWAEQQTKTFGAVFHISNRLEAALNKRSVREMTPDELEGLHDTAKSIIAQGRRFTDAERAQFESLVRGIGQSIEDNAARPIVEPIDPRSWNRLKKIGRKFAAEQRTIMSLSEELDGGDPNGSVKREVYRRLQKADNRYIDRSQRAAQDISNIFKQNYSLRERVRFFRKTHIPELNASLGLSARLAFALNMGNAGNVEAIQNEYSRSQIDAVLATLTNRDWDVVEQIWRYVDSYWPEIRDLEERTSGVAPKKVEASPFTITVEGEERRISGGYYPLVADPNRSDQGRIDYEQVNGLDGFLGGGRAKASTKHGSTIERVGFGSDRHVWLDMRVVFEHLDGVIRDIEMREAVHETQRIIDSKPFTRAVRTAKGAEFHEMYRFWLENTVGANKQPINSIEHGILYARTGVSLVEMGLSLRTILQQPFGLTQTVALLGERYTYRGVAELAGGRGAAVQKVMELSAFMRNRSATMNREVRETERQLGISGLNQAVTSAAFWGIQKFDLAVSIPTWLAAYRKFTDENEASGTPYRVEDAVAFADEIVSRTQGSGIPRDMANVQQGAHWKKMFTMFYTFFSSFYNLQTDLWKQTNFRNPQQALKYAKAQVWALLIPSLLVEYLFNEGPEDEDEMGRWAGRTLVAYQLSGLVGVRDVANSALTGYSYQVTPAGNVFGSVANLTNQVKQGEVDFALVKAMMLSTGYAFHIPGTRQAVRSTEYLWEEGTRELDEFEGWWNLVVEGPERE